MDQPNTWEHKHYAFFCNQACEYFPCHKDIPAEEFNCLFCYCPLYGFGPDCGGNFTYTAGGVKSCIHCNLPHQKDNYGYITQKLKDLSAPRGEQ
ncbi:MAG: cysteine-rich small domain-containing protein [Pseudoflavonifractor sp.]